MAQAQEQYSIPEFAAKIKQRRPDLVNVPDHELVATIIQASPDLGSFLRREPGIATDPTKDFTAGQVAQDQLANIAVGTSEFLGIDPAAPITGTARNLTTAVGNMSKDVADSMRKMDKPAGWTPDGKPYFKRGDDLKVPVLSDIITHAAAPLIEGYEAVKEGDPRKFAHAVGGVVPLVVGAGMTKSGLKKLGFGEGVLETGVVLPKTSKASKAYFDAIGSGTYADEASAALNFDRAAPFLKRSERDYFKREVKNVKDAIAVGKDATTRVYTKDIKPFVNAVEEVDWEPVAVKLKASIPDTFTTAERAKATKSIDAMFSRKMTGEQAEQLRQKLRAEDSVSKIQAKNPFERASIEKTARGWTVTNMYKAARDHLVDVVKRETGQDIGEALTNFGSVTDVTQELLGTPVNPSLLSRIEGTYLTGGAYNIRGQISKVAGSMLKTGDRRIRQAFEALNDLPDEALPKDGRFQLMGRQPDAKGQLDLLPSDSTKRTLLSPPVEQMSRADIEAEFLTQQGTLKRRRELWTALDPRKHPQGQLEFGVPRKPALSPAQALKLWKEADPSLPQPQIELFLNSPSPSGHGVVTPDNPKLGFRGKVQPTTRLD